MDLRGRALSAPRPSLPSLRGEAPPPSLHLVVADSKLPLPQLFLPPRPLAPSARPVAPGKAGKGMCACYANCYLWCAKNVLVVGMFLGMLLSLNHAALDIPGPESKGG